jgi:hypothetical protein
MRVHARIRCRDADMYQNDRAGGGCGAAGCTGSVFLGLCMNLRLRYIGIENPSPFAPPSSQHALTHSLRAPNSDIHLLSVTTNTPHSQVRRTCLFTFLSLLHFLGACAGLRLHHSFSSVARGVRRRPGVGLLTTPCARWRCAAVHIAPLFFFLLFTFVRESSANAGCNGEAR